MSLEKLVATRNGVGRSIGDERTEFEPFVRRESGAQDAHETLEVPALDHETIAVDLRKTVSAALEGVSAIAFDRPERSNQDALNQVGWHRCQ
jgi:hypothetical protein